MLQKSERQSFIRIFKKAKRYRWAAISVMAFFLTLTALVSVVNNLVAVEKQREQFYQTLELTLGRTTLINYIQRLDDFHARKQNVMVAISGVGLLIMGLVLMMILFLRMHQELQSDQQRQSEMIAMITHNARHYLNIIKGRLYLLRNKVERHFTKQEYPPEIDIINENAFSLQQLVNDLNNYELLSSGQMQPAFEPVQLGTLMETLLRDLEGQIAKQQLNLEFDPMVNPRVVTDKHIVMQVAMNLLDNAIKYSAVGGRIRIWITESGKSFKVFIQDHGAGIPLAEQTHVFIPFTRLHPQVRGTGLGLANTSLCMKLLDGVVGIAESRVGEGSTFFFSLPIQPEMHSGKARSEQHAAIAHR